jgi:pheromone shutdown protein TraB
MNTESEEEIRKFSEYLRQGLDINTIHRDRYIVKNINRTLKIRETAVLFIGIGHFENIKNLFKEYNSIYYEEINIDIPYEYISRLYSNIESKLHTKLRKDIIKGNIRSFF